MAFVDRVIFKATTGGTGSFTVDSAVTGYQTPAAAGAIDGYMYSYAAQSSSLHDWEVGQGIYTAGVLTRTVLFSSNSNTLVNFNPAPQVMLTLLNEDVRTKLSADMNYYVATTGNDSNPGTSSLPWLTLQHAINFIAGSIDTARFNVIVNIGVGSFAGFGIKGTVGDGIIQFVGAGSGSTTITAGPNDGVFNFSECISNYAAISNMGIDKVTIDGSACLSDISAIQIAFPGAVFNLGNTITFVAADIAFQGAATAGGCTNYIETTFQCTFIALTGSYSVIMNGNIFNAIFYLQEGSSFFDTGTWNLTGTTDTVSGAAIAAETGASYIDDFSSYSGSLNGPRFSAATGALIGRSALSLTFFPGTINGHVSQGGIYT